jgi:translation initiation factor 2 alpha subunit (eIF-2alpha)
MEKSNKENAEHFVSAMSAFTIIDESFDDEDTIDAYLDWRDTDPFDSNWTAADARLKDHLAMITAEADRTWIEQLQEQGRKRVYMAVIRQTGHADLAAYASDDVDLIIGFLAAGKDDDFTHFLRTAYENGTLPSDK